MTAILDQVAIAITAVGLLVAVVVLVSSRSWRAAIGVLAELLVAAGLVRLSAEPGWDRLTAAAAILVLRRLLLTTLLGTPPARSRSRARPAGSGRTQ